MEGWTPPGHHHATEHMATVFTDEPKDVVVARWEKEHPDRLVKWARRDSSAIEIVYTKKADEEAARLKNENPPEGKRVGSIEDYRRDSLSRRNPGIQR